MSEPWVIVPNWNGEEGLKRCLDSLQAQSLKPHVVVIDNGSADNSVALVKTEFPEVELVTLAKNHGFAGGVNVGFLRAIEKGAKYVAAFNNDAMADRDWLRELVAYLDEHPRAGIAACKLLTADGKRLDSTGDFYTDWGGSTAPAIFIPTGACPSHAAATSPM
jgi:GT2 family glycosyltransferase